MDLECFGPTRIFEVHAWYLPRCTGCRASHSLARRTQAAQDATQHLSMPYKLLHSLSHLIFVAFESPTEALGTLLHASRQALDCNSPGVTESDTKTIKDRSMRTKHKMTTFLGRAWKAQRKGGLKSRDRDSYKQRGWPVVQQSNTSRHQCLLHQGRFVGYCNPPKATESKAHPSRKLHKNHPGSLKALNALIGIECKSATSKWLENSVHVHTIFLAELQTQLVCSFQAFQAFQAPALLLASEMLTDLTACTQLQWATKRNAFCKAEPWHYTCFTFASCHSYS